jgi:uncharacterized protein YjbI with pentapeptide repeats
MGMAGPAHIKAAAHAKTPDDAGRMTDQSSIRWPTCDEDGCIGVRLATSQKCLAHAGDEERNATLKQLGDTGEIDARGVTINRALLEQILAAAPRDADNRPAFTASTFNRAIFQGTVGFHGTLGVARFNDATFQGEAWFGGVTFQGDAMFQKATFQGPALFHRATFPRLALFNKATFQGVASFGLATLGRAVFGGVTFQRDASFYEATFQDDAGFGRTTFQRGARFDRATFQRGAWFDGATFQRDVRFDGATFERVRQLGPFLAYRGLQMDEVQFMQPVQIEATTIAVCCRRARFAGGVEF